MERPEDSSRDLYRLKLLVFRGLVVSLCCVMLASVVGVAVLASNVGWVGHIIDAAEDSCDPSVAVTSDGRLMVAYGSGQGLMLATETDDGWSKSAVIESGGIWGSFSVRAISLAIGGDGTPNIASILFWYDGWDSYSKLIHSVQTSSGWESEEVDQGSFGEVVSIAVDSSGSAHISYSLWSGWFHTVNLTYATDVTGEWERTDVMRSLPYFGPMTVYMSSIVVDSVDTPHVVFMMDELIACYARLGDDMLFEVVGWGNAGTYTEKPSFPSVVLRPDGAVEVLCYSESQDSFDSPVVKTLTRYMVQGDQGSYQNLTWASDTDLSFASTGAFVDDGGRVRMFYMTAHEAGAIVLGDDEAAPGDDPYMLEPSDSRVTALSVAARDGEAILAGPFAAPGYLTDSFTLSERLSDAVEPVQPQLIVLALVAIVLAIAVVLSWRGVVLERKWVKSQ